MTALLDRRRPLLGNQATAVVTGGVLVTPRVVRYNFLRLPGEEAKSEASLRGCIKR